MVKKRLIVAVGIASILSLLVIGTIIFINSPASDTGDQPSTPTKSAPVKTASGFEITNLSEYEKVLPNSEIQFISEQIINTIELNSDKKPSSGEIRPNTYGQKIEDASKAIYLTKFIIDIPEIKQSYQVSNYYSALPPEQTGLLDYTTLVTCLPKDQLIYPESSCVDRLSIERKGSND